MKESMGVWEYGSMGVEIQDGYLILNVEIALGFKL